MYVLYVVGREEGGLNYCTSSRMNEEGKIGGVKRMGKRWKADD